MNKKQLIFEKKEAINKLELRQRSLLLKRVNAFQKKHIIQKRVHKTKGVHKTKRGKRLIKTTIDLINK